MQTKITPSLDHLESLIDQSSLNYILNTIVQICFEKADHVMHDWQDETLARQWQSAARKIEAIADKYDSI